MDVPPFPFLWIPHCILCCLGLRATLGADALQFARRHPLSCFLHGLSYTFAGAIVGLLLKGKSILLILTMSSKLYSYTFVWYLMFFAPGDLPNTILTKLRLQPWLAAAQDWMRLGAVRANVMTALEEQPGTFIYPVALATITSSGLMIVKYVEQLLLGKDCAFMIKQHATKTMAAAAVILTAEAQGYLQGLSQEELFCALVVAAILLRLLLSFLSKVTNNQPVFISFKICSCLQSSILISFRTGILTAWLNCLPVLSSMGNQHNLWTRTMGTQHNLLTRSRTKRLIRMFDVRTISLSCCAICIFCSYFRRNKEETKLMIVHRLCTVYGL